MSKCGTSLNSLLRVSDKPVVLIHNGTGSNFVKDKLVVLVHNGRGLNFLLQIDDSFVNFLLFTVVKALALY